MKVTQICPPPSFQLLNDWRLTCFSAYFCIWNFLSPACIQDSSQAHILNCEDPFFKLGVYFPTFSCVKKSWEYIAVEESELQSPWIFVTSPSWLQSIKGACRLSNPTFNVGRNLSLTVDSAIQVLEFLDLLQVLVRCGPSNCIQHSSEAHIFKCEDPFFKLGVYFPTFSCVKKSWEYITVEESELQSPWIFVTSPSWLQSIKGACRLSNPTFNVGRNLSLKVDSAIQVLEFLDLLQVLVRCGPSNCIQHSSEAHIFNCEDPFFKLGVYFPTFSCVKKSWEYIAVEESELQSPWIFVTSPSWLQSIKGACRLSNPTFNVGRNLSLTVDSAIQVLEFLDLLQVLMRCGPSNCIQHSSEAHIFKCEDPFFKLGVYFPTFSCVKKSWEYIAVEESELQSPWIFVTSPSWLQSIKGACRLSNPTFNVGRNLSLTVDSAIQVLEFLDLLQVLVRCGPSNCIQHSSEAHIFKCKDPFFKLGVDFPTVTCVKANWEYISVEEFKLQLHWIFITSLNRLQSIEGTCSLSNSTFNLGWNISITINPCFCNREQVVSLLWPCSSICQCLSFARHSMHSRW